MLACIDVETTGLDPTQDFLLEVACVLVDDALKEIAHRTWLLEWSNELVDLWEATAKPAVQEMHAANGLWAALRTKPLGEPGVYVTLPEELDVRMCEWFYQQQVTENLPLMNRKPSFDRAWLRRWAPLFEAHKLHYRDFDVTALRTIVKMRYGQDHGPPKGDTHRALDDCRSAIAHTKWFMSRVMTPYNGAVQG